MRQALSDIREALHALREGVVTAVMVRNRAQDDVASLERTVADLDARASLADRICVGATDVRSPKSSCFPKSPDHTAIIGSLLGLMIIER